MKREEFLILEVCDLDHGLGHMAYHHVSLTTKPKFIQIGINFLQMDEWMTR